MPCVPDEQTSTGRSALPGRPNSEAHEPRGSGRLRLPDPPSRLEVQKEDIDGTTLTKRLVWVETRKSDWLFKSGQPIPFIECRLRWSNLPRGSQAGRWQVTSLHPPTNLFGWQNPPALVAQGDITSAKEELEFDVSFPPRLAGPGRLMRPGDPPREQLFFVRVVGIDAEGNPVGQPTNPITIASRPFQMEYSAEDLERHDRQRRAKWVQVTHIRFEPQVDALPDAHYRFIVTCEPYLIGKKKGDQVILTPDDEGGFLDEVGDAISDLGEFVSSATNWVSNAWDDVKSAVVNVIADDILDCGDNCRGVIEFAVDSGLAAMGMPPSLPNFDRLAQLGKGYLVETLVAEAAAQDIVIPPELAERAIDVMIKQAEQAASHGPTGNQCLRPDPDAQGRDPILHVEIMNAGPESSPDTRLEIDHPLYHIKTALIPSLKPGQSLTVPVLLNEPDLERRLPFISDDWKHSQLASTRTRLLKENWGKAYWEEHALKVALVGRVREVRFKMTDAGDWHFVAETE